MDTNKFYVVVNQKQYIANILTNFTIYDDTYCIYTIPDKEKNHNVYCAKINGNKLEPITDEKELTLTNKVVNEFILVTP